MGSGRHFTALDDDPLLVWGSCSLGVRTGCGISSQISARFFPEVVLYTCRLSHLVCGFGAANFWKPLTMLLACLVCLLPLRVMPLRTIAAEALRLIQAGPWPYGVLLDGKYSACLDFLDVVRLLACVTA